jgi:phosphogluconate dehydratase
LPPAARRREAARGGAKARRNIGVVTAYNDMLSAHQPYEGYPGLIADEARAARRHGAGRRGGVPRHVRRHHRRASPAWS